VIVLVGAPTGHDISWVRVITWSTNPAIKTGLRDDLMSVGTLDQRDLVVDFIRRHTLVEFQRIHMKDQKYLRAAWEPSSAVTLLLLILFTGASIGGATAIRITGEQAVSTRYYRW